MVGSLAPTSGLNHEPSDISRTTRPRPQIHHPSSPRGAEIACRVRPHEATFWRDLDGFKDLIDGECPARAPRERIPMFSRE